MRADLFLVDRGYSKSRSKAASQIKEGVFINGKRIVKPSDNIDDDLIINSIEFSNELKYVSRGGLKLEKALDSFDVDVSGLVALDIGASTGGFTDCLLQRNASFVYALDVGHDQLDKSLIENIKVKNMEGINARTIDSSLFDKKIDLIVTDISFISQSLIYESVSKILDSNKIFISLIKPQFEVGPDGLSKNGIVKDKKKHIKCINNLILNALKHNLILNKIDISPIQGGDGNIEYLALFIKDSKSNIVFDIPSLVENAFKNRKD